MQGNLSSYNKNLIDIQLAPQCLFIGDNSEAHLLPVHIILKLDTNKLARWTWQANNKFSQEEGKKNLFSYIKGKKMHFYKYLQRH